METEKYKAVAQRIIGFTDTFKLRMGSFCADEAKAMADKACDTTFCLAGWLAHLDDYPKQYLLAAGNGFNYLTYSYDLIGSTESDRYWHWLFDDYWDDDLYQAKARAQYVLNHNGNIPVDFDEEKEECFTREFLIENKVI
jgi:hypothetical protein